MGIKRHGKLHKNQIENAHEKWQNICSICSHSGIRVPRIRQPYKPDLKFWPACESIPLLFNDFQTLSILYFAPLTCETWEHLTIIARQVFQIGASNWAVLFGLGGNLENKVYRLLIEIRHQFPASFMMTHIICAIYEAGNWCHISLNIGIQNPVNELDLISATLLLMYKSNIYEKFIFQQGMKS